MNEIELAAIGKQLQVPPDRLPRHVEGDADVDLRVWEMGSIYDQARRVPASRP